MEEADSGDSSGSGFEAGGCVFEGDAAEGVDGGGCGREAGGAKLVEALAGESLLVGEGLLEDGGEEDGVDVVDAGGALDVVEGVAGGGDQRRRLAGGGVEVTDLGGGEFVGR